MNKARMGSTLDSFFEERGQLAEVRRLTQKKLLTDQIREAMRRRKVTPSQMAKRMHTSRSAVYRLLSPGHVGLTLDSLERASSALGLKLLVQLVAEGPEATAKNDAKPRARRAAAR